MTHRATDVAREEDPTEGLGSSVGNVDYTGEVFEDDFTEATPFLDCEPLNRDVTNASGRFFVVDHCNGGLVVFIEDRGAELWELEFVENRAKALGQLGGMDSCHEFSFGGAGGDNRLYFGLVGDGGTGKGEDNAGDRAASAEFDSMSGVNMADEFTKCVYREVGEIRVAGDRRNRDSRELEAPVGAVEVVFRASRSVPMTRFYEGSDRRCAERRSARRLVARRSGRGM